MRDTVLAAGMATLLLGASPALALQAGAPAAMTAQPGSWGPQGWQPGTAPAAPAVPTAYATAPAMPAAQPGFSTAPAAAAAPAGGYTGEVPEHVYDRIERGRKVPAEAAVAANTVADPAGWGLPQPAAGYRWIRYYDDAVLLDPTDRARDVRSVPWDMPRGMPQTAYAAAPAYPPMMPAGPMRAPGTYRTRHGSVVTTTEVLPPPAFVGGSYGPYGQVVSVTPGTITTTTRTYWVRGAGPTRHRRAHRRCACGS